VQPAQSPSTYPQTAQPPAYQSGIGTSQTFPGGYATTGQYAPVPPQGAPGTSSATGGKVGKLLLYGFLAILIALCGGIVGGLIGSNTGGSSDTRDRVAGGDVDRTGRTVSLADMAAKLQPSVVSIDVRAGSAQGTGSGVVISKDGLVLTNNHVAGDADEIQVTFHDGKSENAKLVKADPEKDLAVIRIEGATNLRPAKLGDSDKLRIGDTVVAIGSPLGLEGTVTAGIVSGLDRTIPERDSTGASGREIRGVIQTDAAINPGNSGGPLLNVSGEVVGINTAIATMGEHGGNIGLGFAVPVDSARDLIKEAGN
jgi:putative serine protease PepD